MSRLDGKVALITGGARGIGAETARQMSMAGARVVVADVRAAETSETVSMIRAAGGEAIAIDLDVTREAAWSAAVAETVDTFGKLDILVNNAGVFLGRDFEEVGLDEWNRLVAVNLTGVFLGTKLAAPALREAGRNSPHGSAIVNLSSIAGLVGSALDALYSMTKGGVTLFTKSTALAFGRKGDRIRVNAVHPGVIETDMGRQTLTRRMDVMRASELDQARQATRDLYPIGRLGEPEDVARTIVFLASDDARFMTGSSLVVDGGVTAQ